MCRRRTLRRFLGPSEETSSGPTITWPAVGRSMQARILRSEDFPDPEGPTTAVMAPPGNRASIPLSAWTSPVAVQ